MTPRRVERWLVVLIALHSYAVGAGLLFLTAWGARLGGWDELRPLFFARQAGAFHFVIASAYLIEYFRYGGVSVLILTKSIAVVFLAAMTVAGEPWLVPASGVADAAMGAAVLYVRRWARWSEAR